MPTARSAILLRYSWNCSLQIPRDTEADVVAPFLPGSARGEAQVGLRCTAPTRATNDVHACRLGAERVVDTLGRLDHIGHVEVLHPLRDVAAEIVEIGRAHV